MQKNVIYQWKFTSAVGDIYLEAHENALFGVHLEQQKASKLINNLTDAGISAKHLRQAQTEIQEYLSGVRKTFTVQLDIVGTDFQKKVWQQLLKIPYGQTNSYKEIARQIKNPDAVRAVGSANGKNRFCIIIPCHRVIASNGTFGGYSGGIPFKKYLLKLENPQSYMEIS
jgi:methylated-DNA-[protein]-cysteine S-methyltransferase